VLEHVDPKLISITVPSLYLQNLLVPSVHCDINTPAKAIDEISNNEHNNIVIVLIFLFIHQPLIINLILKCVPHIVVDSVKLFI